MDRRRHPRQGTTATGDPVETWCDVLAVDEPFVTFRWTTRIGAEHEALTSDSTLRFRTRTEIRRALAAAGFDVVDVRGAPDRPGREMVFVARLT